MYPGHGTSSSPRPRRPRPACRAVRRRTSVLRAPRGEPTQGMARARVPGWRALGARVPGGKALGARVPGGKALGAGVPGGKALGAGAPSGKARGMLGGTRGVPTGREDGRVEGTAGAGAESREMRRGEGDGPSDWFRAEPGSRQGQVAGLLVVGDLRQAPGVDAGDHRDTPTPPLGMPAPRHRANGAGRRGRVSRRSGPGCVSASARRTRRCLRAPGRRPRAGPRPLRAGSATSPVRRPTCHSPR